MGKSERDWFDESLIKSSILLGDCRLLQTEGFDKFNSYFHFELDLAQTFPIEF